ncbi:MAG: hypothetical protein U9Q33_10940 [Campylobacterota bacterium]|nr:hypothetical protein [Campylobacterota bacterium]
MLNKLKNFADNKYFFEEPLSNVSDGCCEGENKLIDYDKVKEIIIEEANQQTRSSCDGLKIDTEINFFEFKSLKKTLEHNNELKLIGRLNNSLINKIKDSLWLFDYIVNHSEHKIKKSEKLEYYDLVKNYYIVTDVDIEKNTKDSLTIKLNALATISQSLNRSNELVIEIKNILETLEYSEITKPKLISCKELKTLI